MSAPAPASTTLVEGQVYTVAELELARKIHDPTKVDERCLKPRQLAIIMASNRVYDAMMKAKRGY